MMFIKRIICIFLFFVFPVCCIAEEITINNKDTEKVHVETIEREGYKVQIKQYDKSYPLIIYVIFKESTPVLSQITKILKTEILTLTKTRKIENTIIASAWFDDQVSDNLEKIELTKKYGALVRIYDKEEKKEVGIVPFTEYLKYLKKKKEEDKNKEKQKKA